MSSSGYECVSCKKQFSNRSHLRRHQTSHTSQPSIVCEFCHRVYSRNDALRRHYKTCPWAGGQLKPGRPGRPRKACDPCAAARMLCDGGIPPCQNCQNRGVSCAYHRLEYPPNASLDSAIDAPGMTASSQHTAAQLDEQNANKASVPFLLNYSGPGNQHPGDVNRVLSSLPTAEPNDQILDSALPSFDLETERADYFFEDSWSEIFRSVGNNDVTQSSPLPKGLEDSKQRQLAATKMIDCISRFQMERGVTRNTHSGFDNAQARLFFSDQTVGDYIKAYFDQIVRPRSRIVLKSSFHLETVSTPLLLTVFLMGAACDATDHAKLQVVEYTERAECVIFESPVFRKMMYQTGETQWDCLTKDEVEIIQAAILMIIMEMPSPKAETRRRARIQWYPALVSVARATSLTKARNHWHEKDRITSHSQFLRNETCIRMMSSIAMMDCHFIIFFNNPPNLTTTELQFDLPAEEEGIDILDSSSWQSWANNQRKYRRPPPLNQFVQQLLTNIWCGVDDPLFENLSMFSLYVVISAFFRIIFGLRSSICDVSNATKQIERALSRWMDLWKKVQAVATPGEVYRAGNMTHAPDFRAFARLLLQTPLSESGDTARDSMARIHELLKKAPS